jgi:hypothetical protein
MRNHVSTASSGEVRQEESIRFSVCSADEHITPLINSALFTHSKPL